MRKRWGIAWKLASREFSDLVRSKTSIRAVAQVLGIHYGGNGYISVRNRIRAEGLDTSHFIGHMPPKPLADVMVRGSAYTRGSLKRRIREQNLIPYLCAICGMKPEWNGKPLVLRLDHINGINNDHRLENLRFVCPNCDSQLDTFSGKNLRHCRVV